MGNNSVQIGENVHWLVQRSSSLLETNTYLISYGDDNNKINIIVDPGPTEVLTNLQKSVLPLIGGLNKVHVMLINHQDPDVAMNANYIQKMNPNCLVIASEDTWRLIRFFDLNTNKFKAVEGFNSPTIRFKTGGKITFIPTPFCHFRGATMFYDVTSRILFSGDFMGGLSYSQELYANEESWEGIKTFHQIYMPSHEAVQLAVSRIKNLDPFPLKIAPQHGSILEGDLIEDFLDRIYNLPVGLDLLKEREKVENYLGAANEMIDELKKEFGAKEIMEKINRFNDDGSFTNVFSIKNNKIDDFKSEPVLAMKILIDKLRENITSDEDSIISLVSVKTLVGRNIPVGDLVGSKDQEEVKLPDYFE